MAPRLELHKLLREITEHVYFQPPSNAQIQFPCILYVREGSSVDHANNELYRHARQYQITAVDRNPDTELADEIEALPYTAFQRFFVAEDLNHYVFTLFF